MTDIYISHAPADRGIADHIAAALVSEGYRVVRPGAEGSKLVDGARAVVVVWSRAATGLASVIDDAARAARRRILTPVSVAGAMPPPEAGGVDPIDFSGWRGHRSDPRWRFLKEEIDLAMDRAALAPAPLEPALTEPEPATPAFGEVEPEYAAPASQRGALASTESMSDWQDALYADFNGADIPLQAPGAYTRVSPLVMVLGGFSGLMAVAIGGAFFAPILLKDFAAPQGVEFVADTVSEVAEPPRIAFVKPALAAANDQAPRPDADVEDKLVATSPTAAAGIAEERVATSSDFPDGPLAIAQAAGVETQNIPPTDDLAIADVSASEKIEAAAIGQEERLETPEPALAGDRVAALIFSQSANEPIIAEGDDNADQGAEDMAEPATGEVIAALSEAVVDDTASAGDAVLDEVAALIEDAEVTPDQASTVDEAEQTVLASLVLDVPSVAETQIEYAGDFFRECLDCPDMAALPSGSFLLGAPEGEVARETSEGPMRQVWLDREFAISTREVTFAQWDACVADGGCNGYRPADNGWGRGKRPVVNVSLGDARAFVTWLSDKTRRNYRLPTEAEWEYAARAGASTPFSFGASLSPNNANYNGEPVSGEARGLNRGATTPVASFAPNAFGLFDMHGNVWEWTSDCWNNDHAGAPDDGSARYGDCRARVVKGGAYDSDGARLRSAHRFSKLLAAREANTGFRVVVDIE